MYGILEGLRAGGADARAQAQEARAQEEAAANRAFRERQMLMQEAQHRQSMEEGGMRLGGLRRVDTAMQGVMDAQNDVRSNPAAVSAADAEFDAADRKNLQGMPMPAYRPEIYADANRAAPDPRKMNQAWSALAAAKGDAQSGLALRDDTRKMDIGDTAKANIARLTKDPEYRNTVRSYVNNMVPTMVWDEPTVDAKGKVLAPGKMRIVMEDGKMKPVDLSTAQETQIILGIAHMQHGDTDGGMRIISGVNKDVADAVSRADQRVTGMANANTQGQARFDTAQYQQGMLAESGRHNKAMEGRQPKGPVQMSPADAKRINDALMEWENAAPNTPAKQEAFKKFQNVQSAVMSTMGKVMAPRAMPEVLSPAERMRAAVQLLGTEAGQGMTLEGALAAVSGGGEGGSADDRLIAALKGRSAETAKAAKAATAPPNPARGGFVPGLPLPSRAPGVAFQ